MRQPGPRKKSAVDSHSYANFRSTSSITVSIEMSARKSYISREVPWELGGKEEI